MAGRGGLATGMFEVRNAAGERVGPLYSAYAVARWYRDGNRDADGIFYVTRADADAELRRRELRLVGRICTNPSCGAYALDDEGDRCPVCGSPVEPASVARG